MLDGGGAPYDEGGALFEGGGAPYDEDEAPLEGDLFAEDSDNWESYLITICLICSSSCSSNGCSSLVDDSEPIPDDCSLLPYE